MSDQCNHINRVGPLFKGHVLGGASIGQCEKPAMPSFVVCFEHVNKDALALRIQQLERENRELRRRCKKKS